MSLIEVKAIQGFEHNGPRARGDVFSVSVQHAQALARVGLVRLVADAAGEQAASAAGTANPGAKKQPKAAKASAAKAAADSAAAAGDGANPSDAKNSDDEQAAMQAAAKDAGASTVEEQALQSQG